MPIMKMLNKNSGEKFRPKDLSVRNQDSRKTIKNKIDELKSTQTNSLPHT